MDKKHILDEIKRTAKENGGLPLGMARFSQETGIRLSDWHGKHWMRWSAALREAGFETEKPRVLRDETGLSSRREAKRMPVKASAKAMAQRFKEKILEGYFVRFHMALILVTVIASGVLASKILLEAGVRSLPLRYPIAVFGSYVVFLLLVRLWVWYVVTGRTSSGDLLDLLPNRLPEPNDIPSPNRGGGVSFGGGDSGGGGASDLWVEAGSRDLVTPSFAPAPSGSGSGSSLDLPDVDLDDEWAVLLLLAALVVAIFCAGGYLVYVAPDILPEAAWQVVLASGLARASKQHDEQEWAAGVFRATVIPLAVVLFLAFFLGWVAHDVCPHAVKLAEVLDCASN